MKTKKYQVVIVCGKDERKAKGVVYLIEQFGFNVENLYVKKWIHSYTVDFRCDIDTRRAIQEEFELKNIRQNKIFEFGKVR